MKKIFLWVALLVCSIAHSQLTKKITDLPSVSSIADDRLIMIGHPSTGALSRINWEDVKLSIPISNIQGVLITTPVFRQFLGYDNAGANVINRNITTLDIFGTGATIPYALYTGGTTATGVMQQIPNGTTGQVLTFVSTGSLASWQTPSVAWANIPDKPSTFTPSSHTHGIADVNGIAVSSPVTGQYLRYGAGGTFQNSNLLVTDIKGNTGLQTYGIVATGTTATGSMQIIAPGANGLVLTSNGTGALPTWQAGGGGGGGGVSGNADSLGGQPPDYYDEGLQDAIFKDPILRVDNNIDADDNTLGFTNVDEFDVDAVRILLSSDSATINTQITDHLKIVGSVVIGNATTADPSARLDIQSTGKGFLMPRLTTTQRNNMVGPLAAGLQIYNVTKLKSEFYNGTAWEEVASIDYSFAAATVAGTVVTFNGATNFKRHVTLAGNRTLNITGLVPGKMYMLEIYQDATGGRSLDPSNANVKMPLEVGTASAFSLTTTANAMDILQFFENENGDIVFTSLIKDVK